MKLKARRGIGWEKIERLFKARSVATPVVDALVEDYAGALSNNEDGVL